jgi:hypothetical protein
VYSKRITERTIERLAEAFDLDDPHESSVVEIESWTERLADAAPIPKGDGSPSRPLTREEEAFVLNERVMTKASFEYWSSHYAWCSVEGAGIKRMHPLFDSQRLLIDEMGRAEELVDTNQLAEGILLNILKARRLGASTISQAAAWHRLTTQTYLQAVVASDVPAQSSYTIAIGYLMYEKLPWWLRPQLRAFSNTYPEEYEFASGCHVWCHAGQSVRGMEGERGQIGRGKGPSIIHLTELATWDDTKQIDSALLPTLPYSPRALAFFESSPRGRNNWWHKHWQVSMAGHGRFSAVFIPWYAEPRKYRMAAPADWTPSESTLTHARRCEDQGPRWLHVPKLTLNRDQLYWYERTRAYYEAKGALSDFLQEYAADPEECFVFSGKSLIPIDVQQRITDQARTLAGAFEIAPLMDVEKARLAEGAGR